MRGLMTGRELKLRAAAAIDAAQELSESGTICTRCPDRLQEEELRRMYDKLTDCGLEVRDGIALTGRKARRRAQARY